ncbi:MAG: MBL fold metallo-hydrolase [Actinomyces sp.]|nr:MAG: MBL fold metallo-hydrolase [Actinomyces sp.]
MRTTDPAELAVRILDTGDADEPTNRVIQQVSELDDDLAIVESFSHIVAVRTDEGLVCFDTSGAATGADAVAALRRWSTDPVHTVVYTHGHVDHVGGSGALAADADERGHRRPAVVAHEALPDRFARYRATNDWNVRINQRQFGGISPDAGLGIGGLGSFLPDDTLEPTMTVADEHRLEVGGLEIALRHDRGETDDHLWAWLPERRILCVGDFVTWVFPNCGNPQKVQRYPAEWAAALRAMAALDAEWLIGAHGLPVRGRERVRRVLDDLASALEHLVTTTVTLMNEGASLDEVVHSVTLPDEVTTRPWMRPIYDEPEFVVRNIWRLYGGWWDLDPAHLKPAPAARLAAEIARLAGGADVLAERARELAESGDFRLACHLVEFAANAEPESRVIHGTRAEIYQARRDREASLMSKGIYAWAANTSRAVVE